MTSATTPSMANTVLAHPVLSQQVLARVDGWRITTADLASALADILAAIKSGGPFTVFTMNLDHLVKLRRNATFRAAYERAAIVTADGAPVAWLARIENASVQRATGADLLLPLVQAAAEAQIPVFLFGTSAGVMARAGRELGERTDGMLDIAGTMAPSSAFDPEGSEADAAIEKIRQSGAKLCLVALGAPKQEIFSERARAKGLDCGMVCVGAAIDFIAGAQVRAPEAFRNNGFEWIWRLATNPRRLAKRYADCAIVFLDLSAVSPLRRRLAESRG